MVKMYFTTIEKIENPIVFKKLGIEIRKINDEETDYLLNLFTTNILTKEKIKLVKLYIKYITKKEINFEIKEDREKFKIFNDEVDKMTEDEKSCYFNLVTRKIENTIFSNSYIKKNILKFYIINIDESIFGKSFDIKYAYYFISRLFKLTFFLNSKEVFAEEAKTKALILELEDFNFKGIELYGDMLLKKNYYSCDINVKYLNDIANLLNSKDIYFNFYFSSIINSLYNSNDSLENKIINKVSVIERLLIKGNSEVSSQFVLKAGILCNDGILNIENLSAILETIYEVRSYLVHGNEKMFFEKLDVIGKKVGITDLTNNRFSNRFKVLIGIRIFLDIILKDILKKYILNNELCEFIKQN